MTKHESQLASIVAAHHRHPRTRVKITPSWIATEAVNSAKQVSRTEPTDRSRRSPLADYGVSHGGGDAIDAKPPSSRRFACSAVIQATRV